MEREQLHTRKSQQGWMTLFPFLIWLRQYRRVDLPGDVVAGLTVATMLIPQSMAYALLAGLPPVVGLYTGIFPVLIYGLLGSTRVLTLGPTAVTSIMILSSISTIAEPGSAQFYTFSLTLALMLGLVYLLMGMLRLG
ncbi:MAG: sodium-independent anion transporter, partial [Phototrophicales bacterium]